MPLPEILLRQRYAVSFFTTTFAIALTTQSSLAFNIVLSPEGFFHESESYQLPELSEFPEWSGTTKLIPLDLKGLVSGGTPRLKEALTKKNPDVVFNPPKNLAGSFEVRQYIAFGRADLVGGKIGLHYKPGQGDPEFSNRLRWINLSRENINGKEEDHLYDDKIDHGFSVVSGKEDTDKSHKWLAEIYLVEYTEPNHVTIYNGLGWGWENKVTPIQSAPEPLTIFASGVSLGFGVLFKKTFKEAEQKRTKQKVSKS
jgi:hypothetical protein